MKKYIQTIVFTTVTILSLSQDVKKISKNGLSIDCPFEWVEREFQDYLILVSEPAGEQLTFMATFDIELDENFKTIQDFYSNYKVKMKSSEMISDFKVKSKTGINFKGYDAIEIYCSATLQFLPVEWKSIIFIKGGKVYKITTTALVGQFFLLKDKTDKIFDSFKFEE